jgi:hypothetical protein
MISIGDDPEAQLLAFAQTWFRLVARAEWDAALAMLDEPSSDGTRWTRESITVLLHETFDRDTIFAAASGVPAFSDPDLASGTRHHSFGKFDAGGFWLDHDVPLNGAFSDLTAQFEFHPRSSGYAAVLHDLHVL